MKLKDAIEVRKIGKNILKIIILATFVLTLNSLSYAYFTSEIEGEGKDIVLSTSDISIKFTDNESIKRTGLTPGDTIIKTFSVINNGDGKVEYKINWEYLINNFVNREYLVYKITSTNGGGNLSETQLPDSEEHINIINDVTIDPGITQEYTMTITYKNSSSINQDDDKNKSLIGKIEITDMSGNSILPETSTGSKEDITLEKTLYGMTVKEIMNEIYPIGSVYTSTESTNPSERFGGVWERYGEGKTLVSVDESDTNFATVEKTGGSKNTSLTASNLPRHTHTVTARGTVSSTFTGSSVSTSSNGSHTHTYTQCGHNLGQTLGQPEGTVKYWMGGRSTSTGSAGNHSHTVTAKGTVSSTFTGSSTTTSSAGSGTSFSILQPYITVYMWKRVK